MLWKAGMQVIVLHTDADSQTEWLRMRIERPSTAMRNIIRMAYREGASRKWTALGDGSEQTSHDRSVTVAGSSQAGQRSGVAHLKSSSSELRSPDLNWASSLSRSEVIPIADR